MARFPQPRRRHRLPQQWTPYLRRHATTARDLRLMIWGGLLAGLMLFNLLQTGGALLGVGAVDAGDGLQPAASAIRVAGPEIPEMGWSDEGSARPDRGRIVRTGASVRIIDGDTFDYGGERIRIADIDTPELRSRCAEERQLAAAARERLRALLAAGPFELQRLGRDQDRYGRKLRVVTRDGPSLGDVLVAEGLARTWTGRREPWC